MKVDESGDNKLGSTQASNARIDQSRGIELLVRDAKALSGYTKINH